MAQVIWTAQAIEDLESILRYIAADSQHYAQLLAMDVFQAVDRLMDFPHSGRIVPETSNPEIREIILGAYRIIYRDRPPFAEILTVYHAARLLDPDQLK